MRILCVGAFWFSKYLFVQVGSQLLVREPVVLQLSTMQSPDDENLEEMGEDEILAQSDEEILCSHGVVTQSSIESNKSAPCHLHQHTLNQIRPTVVQ